MALARNFDRLGNLDLVEFHPLFSHPMYHSISRDVKLAAIKLFERSHLDLNEILACCSFSKRTWYRIQKLWHNTGDVVTTTKSFRGRLRTLNSEDFHYLATLISSNPSYFLDELQYLLKTNRFISVHFTLIHNLLLHHNINRKRLQQIARERDEDGQADFIARMAQYSPDELGFIDEVSKDERTLRRQYGRSKSGHRARQHQVFL